MNINPDDYRIWIEPYICSFHKQNPGEFFAGCSCSSGFGMFPKDPEKFVKEHQPKPVDVLDDLFVEGPESI